MAPCRGSPFHWFIVLLVTFAAAGCVYSEESNEDSQCEVRAVRCCKHEMFSSAFFNCCERMGCCPRRCMEEEPLSSEESISSVSVPESEEECKQGRVCCRFRPNTLEYKHCCERHQCRPSCNGVPKGCCYNKTTWKWGSVVEAVAEDCVDLKCAAKRVSRWPYLIAKLVLVPRTNVECTEPKCEDCNERRCVDETGMLREEGEKYYMGRCRRCECLPGGGTLCTSLAYTCPPLPSIMPRHCTVVRGLCCETLSCSVERTCRDMNGRERALYTTWRSDPCTIHKCTLAGIITRREFCSPMPHPNCMEEDEYFKVISSGDWRGTSDEDTDEDNDEDTDEDTDTDEDDGDTDTDTDGDTDTDTDGDTDTDTDTDGDTDTDTDTDGDTDTDTDTDGDTDTDTDGDDEDTDTDTDGDDEDTDTDSGDSSSGSDGGNGQSSSEEEFRCCPRWKCGPDCRTVRCSLVPPGVDCVEVFEPLACCPRWKCSGCMDRHRTYHPLGSVWHPTPCTTLACTPLGIVNTTKPCKPKPHDICFEEPSEDACCPVYNCGGCVDEDNAFHPMFSKWQVSHCKYLTCTTNGIIPWEPECPPKPHNNCRRGLQGVDCCHEWECGLDCRTVRCAGPPHSGCSSRLEPLACCPIWDCNTCVDEDNRKRPVGSSWRTDDPCTNHTCTETGVVPVSVTCTLSIPPREGCFQYTAEGECCSRWNCSGCLDDNGVFHRIFEAWSSDTCTRHFCASSGIITQELQCPPLGSMPHPNCVMHLEPGECCSRWKCGPDCRLVFCPLRPEGTCTAHRPPLACCDEYECSTGCTDNEGRKRKVGDSWFTPPCYVYICRSEGIVTHNFCDSGSQYQSSSNLKRSVGFEEPVSDPQSKKAEAAAASPPDHPYTTE